MPCAMAERSRDERGVLPVILCWERERRLLVVGEVLVVVVVVAAVVGAW